MYKPVDIGNPGDAHDILSVTTGLCYGSAVIKYKTKWSLFVMNRVRGMMIIVCRMGDS